MMRAEFAIAVDPIFEYMLQTLAELDRGMTLEPDSVRKRLLNLFDRADALHGTSSQWQLAKYALAAWIDEMLVNSSWDGASWWSDRILEMEFFQTRMCSVRFFELAQRASAEPCRDALEVFVNCVQLGFRGMLAQTDGQNAGVGTVGLAAPKSLQDWLKNIEPRLDIHGHRQRTHIAAQYPQRNIEGAPPLTARQNVIWWSLAAAVLLLVNGWAFQSVAFQWVTGR